MKKIIALISILLCFLSVNAQNSNELKCEKSQFLEFYLGCGPQFLRYNIDEVGKKGLGLGLSLNFYYGWFFSDHWGIGTGALLKYISTSAKINYVQEIENAEDEDGDNYTHRTYFNDLKERQNQLSLALPVYLCNQFMLGKKIKLGGKLGAAYMIPLSSKMKTVKGNLETRSYYSKYDLELFGMDQHYLYTKDNFKGDYNINKTWALFAGVDMFFKLSEKWEFSIGSDFLFGLSDNIDKNSGTYIYNPDCMAATAYQNPEYNGVLTASVTDKIKYFYPTISVGLRRNIKIDKNKGGEPDKKIYIPTIVDNNPEDKPDSLPNIVDNQDVDIFGPLESDSLPAIVNNNPKNVDTEEQQNKNVPNVRSFNISSNFALNKYRSEDLKKYDGAIDSLVVLLKENKNMRVEVTGHTCDMGTEQYNYQLGLLRAKFVRQELIKRGAPAEQVIAKSKGETEPLVPNTSIENRQKNRRIEIKVFSD